MISFNGSCFQNRSWFDNKTVILNGNLDSVTDVVTKSCEPFALQIDPGNIPGTAGGFINFQVVGVFLLHVTSISGRQHISECKVF